MPTDYSFWVHRPVSIDGIEYGHSRQPCWQSLCRTEAILLLCRLSQTVFITITPKFDNPASPFSAILLRKNTSFLQKSRTQHTFSQSVCPGTVVIVAYSISHYSDCRVLWNLVLIWESFEQRTPLVKDTLKSIKTTSLLHWADRASTKIWPPENCEKSYKETLRQFPQRNLQGFLFLTHNHMKV